MRHSALLAIMLVLATGGLAKASAQEAPETPVRVSSGTMAGQLIHRSDPIFPRVRGVSAQAVMRILIGKDGKVERAYAVSGAAVMRPAFLDAVQRWVYRPYLVNGKPVVVDTTIIVEYLLGAPSPDAVSAADAKVDVIEGNLVWVAGRLMEPLLVKQIWPKGLRKALGVVEVKTRVNEQGVVERAEAISGPEALRRAAADAVKQWRYKPYLLDGRAVAVSSSATVRYGKQP